MKAMRSAVLATVFVTLAAQAALAQESKSAALAKQLAAAMSAAKLQAFATKDPIGTDTYIGVFYNAGSQLLIASGTYSAPRLMDARFSRHEYSDAYVDIYSASDIGTRFLIEDAGADGLQAKIGDAKIADAAIAAGKRTAFDGDAKKLSDAEYMKAFAAADEKYARLLTVLLRAVSSDTSTRVAAK